MHCQSISIIKDSLKSVTMTCGTIVTHFFHGASAMNKITFTLINRFQTNCRYHASLTQSLPSSVNLKEFLKLKYIDMTRIEKNSYFYEIKLLISACAKWSFKVVKMSVLCTAKGLHGYACKIFPAVVACFSWPRDSLVSTYAKYIQVQSHLLLLYVYLYTKLQCRAWNSCRPLAIFRPISGFGRTKMVC